MDPWKSVKNISKKPYHALRRRRKPSGGVRFPRQHPGTRSNSIISIQSIPSSQSSKHSQARRSSSSNEAPLDQFNASQERKSASSTELQQAQTSIDINKTKSAQNSKEAKNSVTYPKQRYPLVSWQGRRYTAQLPYLLPSDLKELQRQNLFHNVASQVLNKPTSAPIDPLNPPRRVLDLCCGNAYWVSLCHDFYCCLGIPRVQFTGIDIVNFAPNLNCFGIDWAFVQHDVRDIPFPFEDDYFDLIVGSNNALVFTTDITEYMRLMQELCRICSPGGHVEFRDMDHEVHRLVPNAVAPDTLSMEDSMNAQEQGVYFISSAADLASCENPYMKDLSFWMQKCIQPKHATDPVLHLLGIKQVPGFEQSECKVVAIPFSQALIWEDPEDRGVDRLQTHRRRQHQSNESQRTLREAALHLIVGECEALEPYLKQVCGKNEEEWCRWWNMMTESLPSGRSCNTGESLVLGSWWSKKKVVERSAIIAA